jgi:tetratricopeptide (TPR) repeat protein
MYLSQHKFRISLCSNYNTSNQKAMCYQTIYLNWKVLTLLFSMLFVSFLGTNAAFTVSQQPTDKTALYKEHLKKGDKYLTEKNYAAAMLEYEKASDLMPDVDEPKLKMQSIEATLGINELAEVKRKVELAKKQEQEQLSKAAAEKSHDTKPLQPALNQSILDHQEQSKKDSIRKAIFNIYAEELKQAEKASDMLARAKVYRKIADAFRKVKDDEISLNYYNKALQIEEKYGQQKNVSGAYENIAEVYYSAGDFQNSISNYEKSLSLKEKSGDKAGASEVLSNIAKVYETTYEYKKAIEYFQQSARLKDSINDENGLKDVMNDLGDVYYKQKILASSILSYEKTVDIIQKLDMKEALGPVYNKLGVAHYEMGNYSDAEKFFKESMKNLFESGNRKEAAMTLNNIGNLLYINNNYSEAISYYERSLSAKKEANYNYGQAVTCFNLGNAYRRSGNQELAIKYYENSKRIADSINIPSLSAKNVKALAVAYEASKNFDKAAELEEKLISLGQVSVSIEIPLSENEMDLDHEKTQEILLKLNEEALKRKDLLEAGSDKKMTDMYINNLNKQFMKEQSKSKLFIISTALLGILCVILLFFYRKLKKK